jgi:DNA topoisomerase-1
VASSAEVVFDGFLKVMALDIHKKKPEEDDAEEEADEVDRLPPLAPGDPLRLIDWLSERKETKPPARYSEASLIRALEANGVGRPSTYASIIETLDSRDYVTREKRQLTPTELGLSVSDLLVSKLEHLFDVGFTAKMEESLDQIEEEGVEWTHMMAEFYGRFKQWMELAKEPPADAGKVSAVLALLTHVTHWSPEVQRGKRKYSDGRFVASVIEQIEKGEKAVSDKQLEALAKIAIRYREQIPEAETALAGLGFHDVVANDNAAPSSEEAMRRFDVLKLIRLSETQEAFVTSLRQQAESGRKLSEKQLAAVNRIIVQNAAQIENFDEVRQSLQLTEAETEQPPDNESPLLLEMLGQVTQWQEPVARGKMTFDDKAFFASLADQYDRKKALSPRQRYAMKRMCFRYKAQIPQFERYAEQLGLNKKGKAEKEDATA